MKFFDEEKFKEVNNENKEFQKRKEIWISILSGYSKEKYNYYKGKKEEVKLKLR